VATRTTVLWIAGIGWGNCRRFGSEQGAVGVAIMTEVVLPAFG
jgi:hypothetical protein